MLMEGGSMIYQKDRQKDNTLRYNQLMGRGILDDAVEHILKVQNPKIQKMYLKYYI